MMIPFLAFSLCFGQPEQTEEQSLGEAFNAGAPDVEPIVVGRERWNEKKLAEEISIPKNAPDAANPEKIQPSRITELDPLETEQVKPEPTELPLEAPKIKPAVNIVRNFEGTLVFKPRKFGFENEYPSTRKQSGQRATFVDVGNLKAVDPQICRQANKCFRQTGYNEGGSDDPFIKACANLSN